MKLLFDVAGVLGLVTILLAYFLLQKGKLSDDDHLYNILNLFGAICIGVYSSYYKAWFSVILNVVWGIIAICDLIKNLKR